MNNFKVGDRIVTKHGSGVIVEKEIAHDITGDKPTGRYGVELDNKSLFTFNPVYFRESELQHETRTI